MIKLQGTLPRKLYLACSGGVDSMAALDFLRRNHEVTVLYYNHGTEHGKQAEEFLASYCYTNRLPFITKKNSNSKPSRQSWEEWWRNLRYEFLDEFKKRPVITCHHLDDCVETWIWSSLNGLGKIVPYSRKNVVRPFRLNQKLEFEQWARRHKVPYIEDPSNLDTGYARNFIRHELLPQALKINPGLHKTVMRKVLNDDPC